MDTTRRLIRVGAVIGIALGAGQVTQNSGHRTAQYASIIGEPMPVDVVPLAATATVSAERADPSRSDPSLTEAAPPIWPQPAYRPVVVAPAKLEQPDLLAADPTADCVPTLSLAPRPGAMIDILLTAPCRADERVVLRHAGLAVTYRTNSVGALFASVPALSDAAQISVLFAGGDAGEATLAMPDAASRRRFGVQWMGPQAFGVNAFEHGADFGMPGHVSAADPQKPADSGMPLHGFLTLLGDEEVDTPMLAEIYTFPVGMADVPVMVEAAITKATCGHEILGETLSADGGNVHVADLSVTMPGCDAVGDYLVLKNLAPDMTLAAAN